MEVRGKKRQINTLLVSMPLLFITLINDSNAASTESTPVAAAPPAPAGNKTEDSRGHNGTVAAPEQVLPTVSVVGEPVIFTQSSVPKDLIPANSSVTSIVDAANVLPGVNITGGDAFDSDAWSTRITLRGFSSGQLGFVVDGMPNGSTDYGGGQLPNRFLDPENTCDISVSQGTADLSSPSPQALGGTFNYGSCDPTTVRQSSINYSIGSFDTQRVFGRYNSGTFFGHSTSAYVSLSHNQNDRWIGTGSNGGTERWHIDSKLISYLTDTLTLTGRLSYDDSYENNYNSVTREEFRENPEWDHLTWNWTGRPYDDQNFAEGWITKRENLLTGIDLDWRPTEHQRYTLHPYYHWQQGWGGWLPPYQLYAIDDNDNLLNSYPQPGADFTEVYFRGADGSPLPVPENCDQPYDAGCYPSDAAPISTVRRSLYDMNRYGATLKGEWDIASHSLLAGSWLEEKHRRNGRVWNAVIDSRQWWSYDHDHYYKQYDQKMTTRTAKLYAQDEWTLGPVVLSIGLSKWLVSLEGDNRLTGNQFASTDSDSDILPAVGLIYNLDDSNQLYASYTENFAPLSDGVIQNVDSGADISQVEPESSTNYDLGYRYQGSNLAASLAIYYVRFDNQIDFLSPTSDGVTDIDYTIGTNGSYLNIGGVESKGVEALANYQLTDALSIYGSATYNDSTYLANINGARKGNQVAAQPKQMFVAALNYDKNGFRAGINGKYVGGRYGTKSNNEKLNEYIVFDGRAGYRFEFPKDRHIDLALNIRNLFDESYLSGVDGNESPGTYFIGAPRTVIFTLSTQF